MNKNLPGKKSTDIQNKSMEKEKLHKKRENSKAN
jgi:hypothetical protein